MDNSARCGRLFTTAPETPITRSYDEPKLIGSMDSNKLIFISCNIILYNGNLFCYYPSS